MFATKSKQTKPAVEKEYNPFEPKNPTKVNIELPDFNEPPKPNPFTFGNNPPKAPSAFGTFKLSGDSGEKKQAP